MIDDIEIARALHVLFVAHWIGGVAFVTLVALPLARSKSEAQAGWALFESIENRFAAQVRWSIPLAGLTGLWMTWRLGLWGLFAYPAYWWLDAMVDRLDAVHGDRLRRRAVRAQAARRRGGARSGGRPAAPVPRPSRAARGGRRHHPRRRRRRRTEGLSNDGSFPSRAARLHGRVPRLARGGDPQPRLPSVLSRRGRLGARGHGAMAGDIHRGDRRADRIFGDRLARP